MLYLCLREYVLNFMSSYMYSIYSLHNTFANSDMICITHFRTS